MRYVVSIGTVVSIMLLFYGFSVVSGVGVSSDSNSRIVYVQTVDAEDRLQDEIERLKTIAGIREVLEDHYPSVSHQEKREVADSIYDACKMYDLPVELVLAVIETESAFNDTATSHKGALGLMQVLPRTGRAIAKEINVELGEKIGLFDRRTNILLGSYYLKKMLSRYKRLDHALLAYNAGPTRLDQLLNTSDELSGRYAEIVNRNMKLLAQNYFNQSAQEDD